jgi:thymidylate synthase (FAD)
MTKVEPRVIKVAETKLNEDGLRQLAEFYQAQDWLRRARQLQPNDPEFLIEVAGRACFDVKTEILTDQGWRLGLELNGSEKVATWNHVSNRAEFQPYTFYSYPYRGKMLAIRQQHLDLLITPDHRLYLREKRGKRWSNFRILYTADLQANRPYRFRTTASPVKGNMPDYIQIQPVQVEQVLANQYGTYGTRTSTTGSLTVPIIPYLRLLGFYIAEGSISEPDDEGAGIFLYQKPGPVLDEMISSIKDTGLPYHTRIDPRNGVTQVGVGGGLAVSRHFKEFGSSANSKSLTRKILKFDSSMLKILFDAMWKRDGSYTRNGTRLYHTASENLADDVQELLFKIGSAASVSRSDFADGRIMYLVRELRERHAPIAKPHHRRWREYDGKVWCVTTPNGIVYVRRNKKPVWCGNCYRSFGIGLNPNVTKVRENSKEYLTNVLEKGDGSILEHATVTFAFLNVSRVFTHEIVRHRAGTAISQESLRFVRPREISLWMPPDLEPVSKEFQQVVRDITREYRGLESKFDWDKMSFEQKKRVTSALRRIIPDGIATNIIWTANHRTLRWVIEMRTHPSAEMEIRTVFGKVAEICMKDYPLLYSDFTPKQLPDGTFQYVPKFSKV